MKPCRLVVLLTIAFATAAHAQEQKQTFKPNYVYTKRTVDAPDRTVTIWENGKGGPTRKIIKAKAAIFTDPSGKEITLGCDDIEKTAVNDWGKINSNALPLTWEQKQILPLNQIEFHKGWRDAGCDYNGTFPARHFRLPPQ